MTTKPNTRFNYLRWFVADTSLTLGGATAWAWFYGLSFWLLLVLGVAMAIRGGLLSTASDALLRDVVPAKELPRRMAINEGRDAAVELSGGPIAGALVTWNWVATSSSPSSTASCSTCCSTP